MSAMTERLASLGLMSRGELTVEWHTVWRSRPPIAATPDLLVRGIAWKLQEQAHGTLSRATRNELARIARNDKRGAENRGSRIKPGTRLVRGWHGVTHAVLVTGDGFLFEERVYRSLTAIAHEITGTRWSGPVFFGLKPRSKKQANPDAS
jgi:hypothetical protein